MIVLFATVTLILLSSGKGLDFTKFKTRHRPIKYLSLLIADILTLM